MFAPVSSPRLFAPAVQRLWRSVLVLGAWMLAMAAGGAAVEPTQAVNGLPFIRIYSFDEIGDVSRGVRLTVDSHGRIAAVQDGALIVLNDDVWLDLASRDETTPRIRQVARDSDGTLYYGALGSWGVLVPTESGKLKPRRLGAEKSPPWAEATNFDQVLCRPEGVYFAGPNGLVFWERSSGQISFAEEPGLAQVFAYREQVFVSCHARGIHPFSKNGSSGSGEKVGVDAVGIIDNAVRLTNGRYLISNTGRRLYWYDDGKPVPLPSPFQGALVGRAAALCPLPEGDVAVAIAGQGLFILSPTGQITTALTSPDYRRVNSLATNEPGVLWAATETGVLKILYGAAVTSFGQAIGLPVGWPQIVMWENQVVLASAGRVYEPAPTAAGEPTHFRLLPDQPRGGTWGIAAYGDSLLLAGSDGVWERRPGRPLTKVLPATDVGRLVMLKSGVCFAIGQQIAALKLEDGVWRECAPRVSGVGYPSIVHAAADSAWIELGPNSAARLALRSGAIDVRKFTEFPWAQPTWINLSVVGDLVVLSAPPHGRLFFDDRREEFVSHPPLKSALEAAPYWVSRLEEDGTGNLWASHEHGIFVLHRKGETYEADTATYSVLTEHNSQVKTLPGGGVWISDGESLYHTDRLRRADTLPAFRPTLVSAREIRGNRELLVAPSSSNLLAPLTYAENSVAFRFFAGSYAARHTPNYEFRMNDNAWSSLEASSLLRLLDLHEGAYRLEVRLVDDRGPLGPTVAYQFTILPPRYRTWYAYAAYVLAAALLVFVLVRLFLHRAKAQHAILEKMVAVRTDELNTAMQRLEQETRTAATLAERNRLAGEIHDSLEQGFSGLMFQLETTAGLADCPPAVKGGLVVAKNMVAFSRNEIRHAVWDLHSPMLESGGIEPALKNIIAQIAPDQKQMTLDVRGTPRSLGSSVEHHLLRIAQEAIANAVKHAGASRVDVRLEFSEQQVQMSVTDDGCGFNPAVAMGPPAGHMGLRSMRGRADKIGATLHVDSRPGAGTRIEVVKQFHCENQL
jgi:signal transduction histidine kinase